MKWFLKGGILLYPKFQTFFKLNSFESNVGKMLLTLFPNPSLDGMFQR